MDYSIYSSDNYKWIVRNFQKWIVLVTKIQNFKFVNSSAKIPSLTLQLFNKMKINLSELQKYKSDVHLFFEPELNTTPEDFDSLSDISWYDDTMITWTETVCQIHDT